MMTDEELEKSIKEISEQISQLADSPEKPLSREERRKKVLLQAKSRALNRIKAAKEKGNLNQEIRASMDYTLLCEYGEKHPLLINFMKSQMGLWGL
jgi:hypothetical protein